MTNHSKVLTNTAALAVAAQVGMDSLTPEFSLDDLLIAASEKIGALEQQLELYKKRSDKCLVQAGTIGGLRGALAEAGAERGEWEECARVASGGKVEALADLAAFRVELRERTEAHEDVQARLDDLCWTILGNADEADEVGGGRTGNEFLRAVVAAAQRVPGEYGLDTTVRYTISSRAHDGSEIKLGAFSSVGEGTFDPLPDVIDGARRASGERFPCCGSLLQNGCCCPNPLKSGGGS